MPDTWSVIKTDFVKLDISVAAAILSRACGVTLAEAAFRVRPTRGVLIRGLEHQTAEGVVRELTAANIPTTAVPDSLTLPPPPAYLLRNAKADGHGLTPVKENGIPDVVVPWGNIQVVTAARVRVTEEKQKSAIEQRLAMSTAAGRRLSLLSPAKSVTETHIRDRLHVVGGDPLQHYWIEGSRFSYASILPNPAPIAAANFCLLVAGILRMCPGAATNLRPEQIGEDGSLALEVFEDRRELERVVTWLLALTRLRSSNSSSGATASFRLPDDRTVGMG